MFNTNTMKMVIETERLFIREIVHSDIDRLLEIYNNAANMKFIPHAAATWSRTSLLARYEKANKSYPLGYGIFVAALKTGAVIGEAGFFDSFQDSTHLELGYILDNAFWRQGYGTEICMSLVCYGFRTLGVAKLTARMFAENRPSVKLAEKCGMKQLSGGKTEDGKSYCTYEICAEEFWKHSRK